MIAGGDARRAMQQRDKKASRNECSKDFIVASAEKCYVWNLQPLEEDRAAQPILFNVPARPKNALAISSHFSVLATADCCAVDRSWAVLRTGRTVPRSLRGKRFEPNACCC